MKQLISEISHAALNMAFPAYCQNCNTRLSFDTKIYLCKGCIENIRLCSAPVLTRGGNDSFFREAWHCYKYEGIVKELLHKFKYNKKLFLKHTLTHLFYSALKDCVDYNNIDLIAAVPMHRIDENNRGFNQSAILAKGLSSLLNIDYNSYCLQKAKRTREQIGLSKKERLGNIKSAFSFSGGDIGKKDLLLVDDVFTTGATVSECAKVLMANGAGSVSVITLAKGI